MTPAAIARRSRALGVVMAATLLGGCAADQRIRDAAQESLAKGSYEESVRTLEAGLKAQPDSITLRSGLISAKSKALDELTVDASSLRLAGKFEEARQQLQRALAIDPGNTRVLALLSELATEVRQTAALLEAQTLEQKHRPDQAIRVIEQALKDNPRHDGLRELQRRLEAQRRQSQVVASQSALTELRPITLDFKDASLRTVLDVVSRNSGVNFILDRDIRSDVRVTVFLRDARVEDALDLVIGTNQLAKKVLDSKSVVIYPNTPEKQKEYQEQIVRVFYLASSEAKGAAAFLKSMLKIRDPYVEERTNMLALRDSQENIQLAERLVALYDAGEPEVLLEVEVLEVSSTRLTELGVKVPNSFSLTPVLPDGASNFTLGNLRQLTRNNVAVDLGSASLNLRREVGDVTTLANPKIRVRNKEKASILIGDKIPVVTTTTGTGGFVSDSVNYLDVGLKVNVEPTVYADDEVAIRVALEVSTLGAAVKTNSGTLAYQIGTRNASTLLRLRDGETQMLAGLINREDRSTASRIPGAGDLPVLGRLFSDQQDTANRTELVLAITPHVLRNVRKLEAQEAELWVGTEAAPKLRSYGGLRADLSLPINAQGAAAAQGRNNAQIAPLAATPGNANGVTSGNASAPDAKDKPPSVQVGWSGPAQVKAGDTFTVKILVGSDLPLRGMPMELSYDKARLQLVDTEEGEFFKQNGAATSFSKSGDNATGKLTVGVIRNQATGAQGDGVALLLKFKALTPGVAPLQLDKFTPLTLGAGAPAVAGIAPLLVRVDP